LDSEEFFRILEASIDLYEEFFSCKFPFSKYENVFCPEFRISGMENVGLVNMADKFFKPKNEVTQELKFLYFKVVVHELAHMWFGDLVTMKWWNDLWLKESFADYCAGVCLTTICDKFETIKNPE
jgi:aminopeptidase N